ncbi:breast carcinoma-amplified sequence 4 isoform X3 [Manis javanica]|uniref:breast carcinoma-amplified sequence 4 isoform X3 n=1 Tax=Manis javanica TaxID=9974 RepID=UPI003C6DA159
MLLVDANRPEPVRGGARELALFLTPEPGAEAKAVEETVEVMLLRLEEFCSLTDLLTGGLQTLSITPLLSPQVPAVPADQTESACHRPRFQPVEKCLQKGAFLLGFQTLCVPSAPWIQKCSIRSDTSQILEEHIPVLKAKVMEMRGIYAKVDQLEAFVKMVGHHVSFLEAHVLQAERDHGAFLQVLRRWLGPTGLSSFKNKPSTPAPPTYELPTLYRTEDYFPVDAGEATLQTPSCHRHLVCRSSWSPCVAEPRG